MSLTNSRHQCFTGFVSLEASRNHPFRSSDLIPDEPLALLLLRPCTTFTTSASPGILSSTATRITSMGTWINSGGLHL